MRLSVQSFQRRLDPNDPDLQKKINEFSSMLITQIDTMSQVANAFSDYATLPKAQLQKEDIVELTKRAVNVFEQENIGFISSEQSLLVQLDRTQWIRVMTNLIQNGIQSVGSENNPQIQVTIEAKAKWVLVRVNDNGEGIEEENKEKIFEPKFTTKTKGMGLGLGIVKNIISSHNGQITFKSKIGEGTSFEIKIPKS